MKTIWKYELEITDIQEIEIPKDAEILTVQCQRDKPFLWVLFNKDASMEKRIIETFGTGHDIPEVMGMSRKYIGTYQIGGYVWHVFDYTGI